MTLSLGNAKITETEVVSTILKTADYMSRTSIENLETEFEMRGRSLCLCRITEATDMNEQLAQDLAPQKRTDVRIRSGLPLKLSVGMLGSLESMEFVEDEALEDREIDSEEVLIRVQAFGITKRDSLIVAGRYNDELFGSECSGVVERAGSRSDLKAGEKVFASALSCFKTLVRCKTSQVARIPDGMSFEQAASIPTAAVLGHYALAQIASVAEGDTVLVHNGTSSVAQMAIQLAQRSSARVLTTTSTLEKQEMLASRLDLPDDSIFCTPQGDFTNWIMSKTNGQGVDVVLNTHTGDARIASLECVAAFGKFIDISLQDIRGRGQKLPIGQNNNITYSSVNLREIIQRKPMAIQKALSSVLPLFEKNCIQFPLTLTQFPASQALDAFRSKQNSSEAAKFVVSLVDDESVKVRHSLGSATLSTADMSLHRPYQGINQPIYLKNMQHISLLEGLAASAEVLLAGW